MLLQKLKISDPIEVDFAKRTDGLFTVLSAATSTLKVSHKYGGKELKSESLL